MRALEIFLDLTGAAALGYGAWLAWEPLGFMVGGTLLIWASNSIGRSRMPASAAEK